MAYGTSREIAASSPRLLLFFTARKRSGMVGDPPSITFMLDDVFY